MTRVLVTGASGFVGTVLCEELAKAGYTVRAAVRDKTRPVSSSVVETVVIGDINQHTDWTEALDDVTSVVHTAARVHVLSDSPEHADMYFETNARGTAQLARASASAGVRRMIFLSSVKVNGESTQPGNPYTPLDTPQPEDAYGASKWSGEQQLLDVARNTALGAAIVRSPLVYGPLVRANFLRLLRWVHSGSPLPLGAVDNRRSLVNVWNLCDLLIQLLAHPAAPGRTWMVSDGSDISTADLVRRMGRAMHRPARLLPIPIPLLRVAGSLLGRSGEVNRLCGSLTVDISLTRSSLGWVPPVSLDEALARTVEWYQQADSARTR